MSSPSYIDAVMLLGDSLTQAISAGSFHQRVAEYYLRRLDVVNRGFGGGYNSDWGIPVFERVFATKEAQEAGRAQPVKLITIWFGTNDACLAPSPQHVPVARVKANLAHIISLLRSPSSPYYSPETQIMLITPPPIIESVLDAQVHDKFQLIDQPVTETDFWRKLEVAREYKQAVLDVGEQEGVVTLDLWKAIVDKSGGESDEQLLPFFYDGLHLTSQGYEALFDEFQRLVETEFKGLNPEQMDMNMPHWADVKPDEPRLAIDKTHVHRHPDEL